MQQKDLISRKAAVEILMKYCPDDDGSCSRAGVDLREMLDEIENLPTIDAVPVVHGRWINQDSTYTRYECSVCKARNYGGHERFCPNCGAKMDGDKDALD